MRGEKLWMKQWPIKGCRADQEEGGTLIKKAGKQGKKGNPGKLWLYVLEQNILEEC